MQRVLLYINNNISTIYGAKGVAETLGLSYETFRKNFKRQLNTSPGKYIEMLQLIEFAKSLADADKSVKEAVPRYYRDTDYAIKRFKKYFGMPPGEYRKKGLTPTAVEIHVKLLPTFSFIKTVQTSFKELK